MRVIRHVLAAAALVSAAALLPAAANAADKVCKLAITGTDLMHYDKRSWMSQATCTSVELTLTHGGNWPKDDGHKWFWSTLLTERGGDSGMSAGVANNYIALRQEGVGEHQPRRRCESMT